MIKLNACELRQNVNSYGIIENIDVFKSDIQKKTSIARKVINLFSTMYNEIIYGPKAACKSALGSLFSENYSTLNKSETNKKSLIVFFHGLNGRPSVWNTHIAEFERLAKNNPEFSAEMFAPQVPSKGHCALNDPRVIELFDGIVEWCKNNPGKPVTLFGQSNGSRLTLALEVYLRDKCPGTPVLVSSTGGALYGSSTLEMLTKYISPQLLEKITFGAVTKVACEQLNYGSESSKKLLNEVRQPLGAAVAQRKYQLFGAFYDSHLLNPASSLPILNPNEEEKKVVKHYLVTSYGHNSIVNACTEKQVKAVFNWTSELTNSNVRLSNTRITLIKSPNSKLVGVRDSRSILQKICAVLKAAFNHITVLAVKMKRRITKKLQNIQSPTPISKGRAHSYFYPSDQLPWQKDKESKGLFLTVHGLRGSTTEWEKYENDFKQQYPGAHHFNPHVALEGNCPLEEAAKPLLKAVEDYLKKFPGSPITIIGTSNGGRIAAYLESHLSPELLGNSKLLVVSVAGVHYGTKVIDRLDNLRVLQLANLNSTLADEFHWGSEVAEENLKLWQDKQTEWKKNDKKVSHFFIATTEDEQVRGQSASLPQAPSDTTQVKYAVYNAESHISIVDASHSKVMKWINKKLND